MGKAYAHLRVLTVEGKLQRTGRDGRSISIVVEKVIVPWTGLLSDLKVRLEET